MSTAQNLTIEDLPESVKPVAELIGVEKALTLARSCRRAGRHSGFNIHIPKLENATPAHWISRAIGWPCARKLFIYFGGCNIPFAKCADILREERDGEIKAAYIKGELPVIIAQRHGVNIRTVFNVLDRTGARTRCAIATAAHTPPGVGSSPTGVNGGRQQALTVSVAAKK